MFFAYGRRKSKICILLLVAIVCIYFVWYVALPNGKGEKDYSFHVRLKEDQEEYIDRRGIHVVVGHYVGDDASSKSSFNLTDEILNRNMFHPIPKEGANGLPVMISPSESSKMQALFSINRFNLLASDKIPLNRSLPDVRKKRCLSKYKFTSTLPTTSVIIVFHNEAWSTLLRTVQSVIDRSPREALLEIILVDDGSTRTFLKDDLEEYVSRLPVKVVLLRMKEREGLIRARLLGAQHARGSVLTFLDAHCECTTGWLEPLLLRISQNRSKVVCPVIDIISDDTFAYIRSFELHWGAFNWNLHFRWYTLGSSEIRKRKLDIAEPFTTPAMAGGLFAIDRNYFFTIGAYDEQMKIWGGENLEMSFRVWQCGGSIEIVPCSHVGHLFRKSSPYSFPGGVGEILYANLARVALVWMDEWKEFFFKFNPEAARQRDKQSVRSRIHLRNRLKCSSFEWYLDNVWPQHFFPKRNRFFGQIKQEISEECLERPMGQGSLNQPSGVTKLKPCKEQLEHIFVKTESGDIMTDESLCLDVPDWGEVMPKVKMLPCSGSPRQKWEYQQEKNELIHGSSRLCMDAVEGQPVLAECSGYPSQKWTLVPVPWTT